MGVDDVISVYKQAGEASQNKPADSTKTDTNPQKRHGDRRGRHRPRRRGPGVATVCVTCGKETEVPFEPTAERPAYCQECYRQVKSASRVKPEPRQPEPKQDARPEPQQVPEPVAEVVHEQTAIVAPPPALTAGRPEDLGDNRMNADRGWAVEEDPEPRGRRSVVGEFTATPLLHRPDSENRKSGAPSEHSLRGTNPRRYTSK